MDQNVVAPNALAETIAALAAAKARSEEVGRVLTKISTAMDRCRAVIAEHGAAEQTVAALRADRVKFLADAALGGGDATALARNDRDVRAAEGKLKDLCMQAQDGKAAIAELEARYAVAQAPLIALSKEIPRLQTILLEQAMQILLAEYAEKLVSAYAVYCETIVLVQTRNFHARAAGMSPVLPETPATLDFPGIPSGKWNIRNTMGAGPSDMAEARERLAKKLAALGVAG